MSGTEAAATLSLEISTGGAEARLRELALAYATLKTELSGSVSASGISDATNAELVAVRRELAATKASYVALNDTVEGFKRKMNTPVQGSGTGMFTGLNKDIERSSSNLKIMLTSAEMTGKSTLATLAEIHRAKNLANSLELRVIAAEEVSRARDAAKAAAELGRAKNQANALELKVISNEEAAKLKSVKKDAEDLAKWLALTQKQQAAATLQASKALYGGAQQSLLPGAAGSSQALAAAQTAGSVQAAQVALDGLSASHNKAATAAKANADATNKFTLSGNDAHAMARGLSGTLGTLWMTYGAIVPLMAGAALGAGFKEAAKAGSEFAYQLTFVKALGGESAEAIKNLADQAKTLAKDGLYGPNEIASGYRILAQAGLDATQALAAMPHVLNLATVGEMSMEQAGVALVGVMNAFNLSVKDSGHISDVFAKAAAVSQTSVSQMTEAMRAASVVGEQYGASMEDTATAVTLLAKVNITGTAAGTSLRNMLKEIYSPGKQAADTLKMLGVSAQDATTGGIRPFADVIYDLKDKLEQYDKASQIKLEQKLFGERGAKEFVQMVSMSRDEWNKFKASIADSDGFSVGVAQQLEDTVQGKWKQALNTMKVSLLNTYEELAPTFGRLADSLKNLFSSSEFTTGTKAFVTSMVTVSSFLVEHGATVLKVAEAYLAFKAATLGASVALAGINGIIKVTEVMSGLSAATSAAGAGISLFSGTLGAVARGAATTVTGLTGVAGVLSLLSTPITIIAGLLTGGAVLWALWGSKASEASDQAKARVDVLKGSIENINGLFENLKYAGVGSGDSFLAASNRALAEQSKAYNTIQSTINASGLKFLETPADRNRKLTFDYGSGDITDESGKKYATSMLKNSKALDELIAKFKATGAAAREAKAQADKMFAEADASASATAAETARKAAGTKVYSGEKPDKSSASDKYKADIEALKGYIKGYEEQYGQFKAETARMQAEGSISELQMLTANWADKNALLEAQMEKQREIIARAGKEKNKSADVVSAETALASLQAAQERGAAELETALLKSKQKTNDEVLRLEVSLGGKLETERDRALTVMQGQYAKILQEAANNGDEALVEKLGKIKEAYLKAADIKDAAASINNGLSSISVGLTDLGSNVDKLEADMERDGGWVSRIMNTSEITTLINERLPALRAEIIRLKAEMAAMPEGSEDSREYLKIQKDIAKAQKEIDKFGNYVPKVWKDVISKIDSTFHEGFSAIFSKGKTDWSAFGRSLAETFKTTVVDSIYEMFARKWVMNVVVSVAGSLGVSDMATAATSVTGAGATNNLGSIGSLASGTKSAYDLFNDGASGTYESLAKTSLGQSLGLSEVNQSAIYGMSTSANPLTGAAGMSTAGTGLGADSAIRMTDLGSSIGTSLAYTGAGLIGSAIGNAIAGDKRIISGVSTSMVGSVAGGLAGSLGLLGSIAGPLGAGIGGVVGGLFDAAFGMGDVEYTDKGIQGTFSGASFSGNSYQNWEQDGGWFRSDDSGTDTSPLDSATTSALSTSFTLLKLETGRLAAGLGVDTANIAAYSKAINVTLTDDATANAKAISDMIAGISEEMSAMVLAGTNFGLAGETSSETLSRLYNSLTTVNQAFASINMTAYETSLAGGDMASQLALLMGGIDAFKTSITSYYGTYFSAEEQQADLVKQTTASIQALGIAVPATKEQFRALVESLDVTTASGRATFAGLMSVSAAFATMTDAAEATAKAAADAAAATAKAAAEAHAALLQSAQDAIGSAVDADYSALERAVSAQKTALQTAYEAQDKINQSAITAATSVRNTLSSLADTLESAVGTIVADADSNLLSLRNAAQTVLDDAYAASQSGLSLDPYSESIKSAITELSKPSDQVYSTYEEYARAQGRANAAISALSVAAGDQLDVADLTLRAIKDAAYTAEESYKAAIADLDATLANAQAQIDVLRGIDVSILSVKDAIAALAAALGAAAGTKVTPAASTVGKWTSTAEGRYYQSSAGAVLTQAAGSSDVILHNIKGETASIADLQKIALTAPAENIYAAGKNAGLTMAELNAVLGAPAGTAETWAKANNLPMYASGGDHLGGLRLVGENGPELEATGPSRIFNADQTRNMLRGSTVNNTERLELLVEKLTEEVNLLRYEARATATNTGKAAKTLDKFDNDGLPAERVAA